MLPGNGAPKSPKLLTRGSLLIAGESPLPRPPGCLVKCEVDCPESNLAGNSPRYPVRYPESYLVGSPAGYWADYSPENPVSNREVCLDRNSAGYSADCPDNRPEGNPESNLRSNGADSLPGCSAGSPVNSWTDCPDGYRANCHSVSICVGLGSPCPTVHPWFSVGLVGAKEKGRVEDPPL
jgi:hypothetical protein